MQTLIPAFRGIPRTIFIVLVFAVYTVAGVAGREHFSAILSNFLAVVRVRCSSSCSLLLICGLCKLGYWLAFWVVILVEEHCIFRRKGGALGGYDLRAYESPELRVPSYHRDLSVSDLLLPTAYPSGSRPCLSSAVSS
jgi:hypothetical protein